MYERVHFIFVKERKTEPLQNKLITSSIKDDEEENKNNPHKVLYMISHLFEGIFYFSMLKDVRHLFLTMAVFLLRNCLSFHPYLFGILCNRLRSFWFLPYLLITLVNVCGISARFVLRVIAGRFNVMIASSILTTIIIFAVWLPAKGSMNLLYAFSVLFGVVTSANISLIDPTIGQITWGTKIRSMLWYVPLFFVITYHPRNVVLVVGHQISTRIRELHLLRRRRCRVFWIVALLWSRLETVQILNIDSGTFAISQANNRHFLSYYYSRISVLTTHINNADNKHTSFNWWCWYLPNEY